MTVEKGPAGIPHFCAPLIEEQLGGRKEVLPHQQSWVQHPPPCLFTLPLPAHPGNDSHATWQDQTKTSLGRTMPSPCDSEGLCIGTLPTQLGGVGQQPP